MDGNVSVRLVGDEFVDGTSVRLGEAGCQQVEVLSTNHIRCIVPAAEMPGRVDVTVTWPDGTEETLVDGFSYFVPLEAESLTPPVSPVSWDHGDPSGAWVHRGHRNVLWRPACAG